MSFRVRTAHKDLAENPTQPNQTKKYNKKIDIVSAELPTIPKFTPKYEALVKNFIPPISIKEYEKNLRSESADVENEIIVHDKTNDKWILVKESESYRYL